MRKLFLVALTFACASTFGQGKNLWDVEMVQTKLGHGDAYEKAWKSHVAKFHNGDDKRYVFEILTGSNTGNFLVVSGPNSVADMDVTKPNSAAHSADYDMTVTPFVSNIVNSGTYRYADTLSFNPMNGDKLITTIYHLKPGKQGDFVSEIKKALNVNKKINSPASYSTYIKMWAGSSPEVVIVTNLKDGFKQLDNSFNPSMGPNFQNAYIQEYGQAAWDKRLNLLPEICTSWETYVSKFRNDLSSKETPVKK